MFIAHLNSRHHKITHVKTGLLTLNYYPCSLLLTLPMDRIDLRHRSFRFRVAQQQKMLFLLRLSRKREFHSLALVVAAPANVSQHAASPISKTGYVF